VPSTSPGSNGSLSAGESGHGARPFAIEWAESLVQLAKDQGCTPFVKQLGRRPTRDGNPFIIVGNNGRRDAKGKHMDRWPESIQIRQFPIEVPA
jgi:protein gp37